MVCGHAKAKTINKPEQMASDLVPVLICRWQGKEEGVAGSDHFCWESCFTLDRGREGEVEWTMPRSELVDESRIERR